MTMTHIPDHWSGVPKLAPQGSEALTYQKTAGWSQWITQATGSLRKQLEAWIPGEEEMVG